MEDSSVDKMGIASRFGLFSRRLPTGCVVAERLNFERKAGVIQTKK